MRSLLFGKMINASLMPKALSLDVRLFSFHYCKIEPNEVGGACGFLYPPE